MGDYPLQKRFFYYGLLVGIIGGVLLSSFLVGISLFLGLYFIGLVWRKDEVPIFVYSITKIWIGIATGFLFLEVYGYYPGFGSNYGNIEDMIIYSLGGLFFLIFGIRAGISILKPRLKFQPEVVQSSQDKYRISLLFFWVILLNSFNWFTTFSPNASAFNYAQFLYRLLDFRTILFYLLLLTVLRQREGYLYAVVAFLFVWFPSLVSERSSFSWHIIIIFLVLMSAWKPWAKERIDRRRTFRITIYGTLVASLLVGMALLWNGGMKFIWRATFNEQTANISQTERIKNFFEIANASIDQFSFEKAFDMNAGRLSSGSYYCSFVIERVPDVIPYEDGFMIGRAIRHILMPRFLFPEKENLGKDSWLVRKYAGQPASDTASIGLGFIPQFYIDFGVIGIILGCLFLGILIGILYIGIFLWSPSYLFAISAGAVFIGNFADYDIELAKLLGAFINSFIIFCFLLRTFGYWLHKRLIIK